jgi:PAS domain S-box-containing protein
MSYVTVIWSVVASCALLLAFMYGYVWLMDRKARASLAFAILALSVVGVVVMELAIMRAQTTLQLIEFHRWIHVFVFPLIVAILAFIRLYFGAGRAWLMWTIIGIRCVVLVLNFTAAGTFNYDAIGAVARVQLFGEEVSAVGEATVGRWQWLGLLSTLLILVYLVDAAMTLWREGSHESRRRAIVIGSSVFLSAGLAILNNQLATWEIARIPPLISLPFLLLFAAMALEISRDTLRSARLARELRQSEERMVFSADAAGVGLWSWDVADSRIWATRTAREMFGVAPGAPLDAESLRGCIHADDLPRVDSVLRQAATEGVEWETEFRVAPPGGTMRWLRARGRSETDEQGHMSSLRGVLRDVTEQRSARHEIEELRRELAHAGRVSVLGTLSSSIAHELGQPLGAILTNAEVAEKMLKAPQPDIEELRTIVQDIQRDDLRAGDIISSLRSLLKRRELEFAEIRLDNLVHDLALLLRLDAMSRHVLLECRCDPGLPAIRGDRVHLTQVLINIVMNAMDAVAQMPAERRKVGVQARRAGHDAVEIEIEDSGPGIPAGELPRVFDPFYTTKKSGTGLGLSVSRTIVEAHHGTIAARNSPAGGAIFLVRLPIDARQSQNSN